MNLSLKVAACQETGVTRADGGKITEIRLSSVEKRLYWHWLGLLPYCDARKIQELTVAARLSGASSDTVYTCEHPPTVTRGKRGGAGDLLEGLESFQKRGIEIVDTDRGGGATYHGPGQLLIYPVLSLRERNIGVRKFVECGLSALGEVLSVIGLRPEISFSKPGIWVAGRKIASVGLHFRHGISDHGFALNIRGDVSPFELIVVCGESATVATSIERETGTTNSRLFEDIEALVQNSWNKAFP